MMRSSLVLTFVAVLGTAPMLAGCFPKIEDSPAYQAACQGPPLGSVAKRVRAEEDGYDVNKQFDCIDKASYLAMTEARAAYRAANTPEGLAEQRRAFAEANARRAEEWKRKKALDAIREEASRPHIVLRRVDANTAAEADIANIFAVGPEVAAQIAAERAKRRFDSWDDLVSRVVGLSAAQSAFHASVCGLTVDGQSMAGAPLDANIAASIYQRRYERRAVIKLAP